MKDIYDFFRYIDPFIHRYLIISYNMHAKYFFFMALVYHYDLILDIPTLAMFRLQTCYPSQ